ncbi:hypothetical protein [Proteiniclasticum ruminis]|jgi:hypothetical protein|uniref:hypothetical protein n=1 Tax=Proteiniclasticum ruminis TaxID=398199 RepID=UPI002898A405|nr:hypothetical protein [Proteiniclasticum ruminis]
MKIPGLKSTTQDIIPKGLEKKNEAGMSLREEKTLEKEVEKDRVVLGGKAATPVTYGRTSGKRDASSIEKLQAESEKAHEGLRELVRKLLESQGMSFRDLSVSGEGVKVDEATRMKAEEMLGDGGLYSPEAVSERVVSFAKAVSGGDRGKMEELITAIDKGFEEARNLLGGSLPEISNKTYDLIQEKLKIWKEE